MIFASVMINMVDGKDIYTDKDGQGILCSTKPKMPKSNAGPIGGKGTWQ